MAKLPNGQEYDQWHSMVIPGTKATRGTLRLVATFKHEVILKLEEYTGLKEVWDCGGMGMRIVVVWE